MLNRLYWFLAPPALRCLYHPYSSQELSYCSVSYQFLSVLEVWYWVCFLRNPQNREPKQALSHSSHAAKTVFSHHFLKSAWPHREISQKFSTSSFTPSIQYVFPNIIRPKKDISKSCPPHPPLLWRSLRVCEIWVARAEQWPHIGANYQPQFRLRIQGIPKTSYFLAYPQTSYLSTPRSISS